MSTLGSVVLGSAIGGMVAGAIGGAAGEGSDHPAIKGAVVVGLINAIFTAVMLEGVQIGAAQPQQTGTGRINGVTARSFP